MSRQNLNVQPVLVKVSTLFTKTPANSSYHGEQIKTREADAATKGPPPDQAPVSPLQAISEILESELSQS